MSMRKKHVARVIAQILEMERLDKGTNEGSGEKASECWVRLVGKKEDCHCWKEAHEV